MHNIAIVFCYLNLFSITKTAFDYNSWKKYFDKELSKYLHENKVKTNFIIEIDEKNIIEITLEKSIYNIFEDSNRLAIELQVSSNIEDNEIIKNNLYLIKPIIIKIIDSINKTIINMNIAQLPSNDDYVFVNNKFYTLPNTESKFKLVQIIAADLHYLYGSNELIHVI